MLEYLVLDVFAESPLAGNQLAVVRDAQKLDVDAMQAIAREFNLSETTFIQSPIPSPSYDVRIFTPMEQLPFAGHPTLGTAWAIRHLDGGSAERVTLRLGVGEVPVDFENDAAGELAWMRPPMPELGDEADRGAAAQLVGLELGDIDPLFPVQQASVGISFLIVPVNTLDALQRVKVDAEKLRGFQQLGVLVFCSEGYESHQDLTARMLFDANGVREDPATGSANTCLGAYLARHRYFGEEEIDVRVGQGYAINRPSTLYIRTAVHEGDIFVTVGGRVSLAARGQLFLGTT